MSSASFGPCPECGRALAFLMGVTGSQMNPQCPCCHAVINVTHATFLMADNSRPNPVAVVRKPTPS
jgi:hypothetical protein